MIKRIRPKQTGFTIIELLIATLVFSLVLIVMLTAFVRTGDLFYKGVSMNNTQEDARNIVQSIADDINFSQSPPANIVADINQPAPNNSAGVFCVGDHRYRFQIAAPVGLGNNYGFARDTIGFAAGCPPVGTGPGKLPVDNTTDQQMLDNGMQLNALNVTCSSVNICKINIHLLFYGGGNPDEIFSSVKDPMQTSSAPDAECNGSLEDTQLCATADFDSTVLVRTQ